jgi:hypothetical protein
MKTVLMLQTKEENKAEKKRGNKITTGNLTFNEQKE